MSRQSKIRKLDSLSEFFLSDRADVFILFADLCGSTQFKQFCISQGLPEQTWMFRQLLFLQRVADLIKKHQGIVVKTVGDEIIAFFKPPTTAEEILKCAVEIIQSFESFSSYKGRSRIEVKVSIDFGETYNGTITDTVPYDPIGIPVDRCARLNSITGNNEITFSQDFLTAMATDTTTEDQLKAKYGFETRQEDLKGIGLTIIHSMPASIMEPPKTGSI
jgi:class 3 adenylate cyclase